MTQFKALLLCVAGALIVSTPLSAQGLTPDNLVAQAEKEGKVVWYTTPGTELWMRPALEEWKRTYPKIPLEIVEASGPDHTERLRTERRAGRQIADMVNLGDGLAFQFAEENAFQTIDVKLLSNFPTLSPKLQPVMDSQNRLMPIRVNVIGMVVNTALVPEADQPRKWTDLLSPKFVGKLSVHDFSRIGNGFSFYLIGMGEPTLGEKFFADLMRQKPRVVGRSQESVASVVRGERWVAVPAGIGDLSSHPTAPIKMIYPEDGSVFIVNHVGIVANAPHRAAAHLFLNFLLSPQVQSGFVSNGFLPVRDDVKSGAISLASAKFLGIGFWTPDLMPKIDQYLETAKRLLH